MNCNELLLSCLEFDEPTVAYDLMYLMQEGYVTGDSPVSDIDWNLVDKGPVNILEKNNILGFNVVDLYSALCYDKFNNKRWLMILARSLEEVRGYCIKNLGYIPKITKMPKHKELTAFWFSDEKNYKSVHQLKKEKLEFPCLAFEL